MNINVFLNNATLALENAEATHADSVIKGFFGVLTSETDVAPSTGARVTSNVTVSAPAPVVDTPKVIVPTLEPKTTSAPAISKVLPKINDQRTLQVSIGEALAPENEHWLTGIKVEEDGTKRYRAYYWCDCGGKGKRYVFEKDDTLDCRECGSALYLESATPNVQENGLPERDSFGNFFIAREKAE